METKVLTPKGFKLIGDIAVGEQVCNPDGTVARVVAIHDQGLQLFYRVTLADGSTVEASEGHLWAVSIAGLRRRRKEEVPAGLRPEDEWNLRLTQRCTLVTTQRLMELVGRAATDKEGGGRGRYVQIPLTSPVSMTGAKGRWPVMPPYTLGVLMGDGSLGRTVSFVSADPDIAQGVRMELAGTFRVAEYLSENHCPSYCIYGAKGQKTGSPQDLLRRDKLLGCHAHTKFVPDRLKRAPVADRLAFIQGLFDTDGYMDDRGHVEYATVSERLAVDAQYMLRSLGFKATVTTRIPTFTYKGEKRTGRLVYRVWVRGPHQERLFRLQRKVERAKQFNGGDVWPSHRVISVEPSGVDHARCITVDHPNGLYVTDDFIVTHNSFALLMGALQYIDEPNCHSIILRRTFKMLEKPDSIMYTSHDWLGGRAKWSEQKHQWTFPSGSTLTFGHMEHAKNIYDYQGAAFAFVGYDELTQFMERMYRYLFSRQRRAKGIRIPRRTRAASNPGGPGHSWVFNRFINPTTRRKGAIFVPAKLQDNPNLDQDDYIASLAELDPITRAQLLSGDWNAHEGGRFKKDWLKRFKIVSLGHGQGGEYKLGERSYLCRDCWRFITVDPAASSEDTAKSADPDYTVVATWAVTARNDLLLIDCDRFREEIPDILPRIQSMYDLHRPEFVAIEAVASNRAVFQIARRTNMIVREVSPRGQDKLVRATKALVLAESGRLWLPESAHWLEEVESELLRFTGNPKQDAHDDALDCLSYAAACLDEFGGRDDAGLPLGFGGR